MIRRLLSVLISALLTAGFVSSCAAETEKPVMSVLRVSEIPAREWQKTAVFPDWKGYPDNTLAMVDASRDLVIVYLTNKINSPVTDGSNPNKFDGNAYTASSLRGIARCVGAVETFKNTVEFVFRNTLSCILDSQSDMFLVVGNRNLNLPSCRCELKGIRQQIDDNLIKVVTINPYG